MIQYIVLAYAAIATIVAIIIFFWVILTECDEAVTTYGDILAYIIMPLLVGWSWPLLVVSLSIGYISKIWAIIVERICVLLDKKVFWKKGS